MPELIKIDESLINVLKNLQKEVAEEIKKKYHLSKITIYGTTTSEILANLYTNKNTKFVIKKKSLNEGTIEIKKNGFTKS